jgi:hypothetical protein
MSCFYTVGQAMVSWKNTRNKLCYYHEENSHFNCRHLLRSGVVP